MPTGLPRPARSIAIIATIAAIGGALAVLPRATVAQPAVPQPPAAAPATPAPPSADTAALVLQNRTITVFRSPLGALSPADRADAAQRRLRALVDAGAVDSVAARPIPEGVLVTVAGQGVFTLTPGDADTLGGQRLADAANLAVAQLRTAIAAAREETNLAHLLRAAVAAVLATIVFIAVLRLLKLGRRRVSDRLLTAAARHLPDLRVWGFTIFSGDSALAILRRAVDLAAWGTGLFAAYLWLAYVLTRFAYSRPWGEALGGYLSTTIGTLAFSAISAIPGIFTVLLILVFTRWLVRIVGAFFDAVEAGNVEVPWPHPETANPTKRIVLVLLWLFAIVVAYPYVPGSGSDVFKGVSVFAGLVISLGSSGIVNQAMSGLVLMYSRALKPGDYVRVGDVEGTVMILGMLSTKIRTTKREEVTLPNAVVVGASVKNYSRTTTEGGLLVYTSVTIGYDTPWRQVEAMLIMAAERTEGLRADPAPFVLKSALSDFYVEYQLNAILEFPETRNRVLDRLHANILDCFNEYGVQIMSPHYEGDPPRPAVVPRDRWYAAPAWPAGDGRASDRGASAESPGASSRAVSGEQS